MQKSNEYLNYQIGLVVKTWPFHLTLTAIAVNAQAGRVTLVLGLP